jgi:hypothetical protein
MSATTAHQPANVVVGFGVVAVVLVALTRGPLGSRRQDLDCDLFPPFALRTLFRAEEVRMRHVWGRPHRPQRTRKHAGGCGWEAGPV